MAANSESSGNQPRLRCHHCHQAVSQKDNICPNCNRDLTVSRTWPPFIPHPYPLSGSGMGHSASKLQSFLRLLVGCGIGFWAYILILIALWVGGAELSKRYLSPYSGSVGIIIWIIMLAVPLLSVCLPTNWYHGIEPKMLQGVKLGAALGLLLAIVLLFLLLHNTDWRQDLGY